MVDYSGFSKEELIAQLQERDQRELMSQSSEASERLLRNDVEHTRHILLHQIIQQTSISGFWLVDMQGNLLDVNDRYAQMSGYSQDELLQMSVADLDIKGESHQIQKSLKRIITNKCDNFESVHRKKNGTTYDVEVEVQYLKTQNEYLVAFIQDISERKQKESELVEKQERLKLALKSSRASIFENNFITGESVATPDLYIAMGYSEDEVPSTVEAVASLVHPEDLPKLLEIIRLSSVKGGVSDYFEYRLKGKNGEWYWVHGRGNVIQATDDGEPVRLVGFVKDITAQKEAQKQLEESEQRLKLSLQINNATIFEDNFKTGSMITTPDLFYSFGYTDDEIPTTMQGAIDLMHPDDYDNVMLDIERHINGETELYYTEYRMMDKSGNWRWIDGKGKIVKWTESGEAEVILGISQEITDRKKAENDLHQYEHIVSTSTDMLALVDLEFNYLATNDSYANAFGKTPSEMTSFTVREMFGGEVFEEVIHPELLKCFAGLNVNYQRWFTFPEHGKCYMDVHYIPYYNEDAVLTGFVVNVRDITEKKLADEALEQTKERLLLSEERYKLAVAATNLGVWDWTVGETSVYYSDVCVAQIGYTLNEWESTCESWEAHLHPDDVEPTLNAIKRYLKKPEGQYVSEYRWRHKDGSYRWIHSRAEGVKNERGNVCRLFGSHRDITDLKSAQIQLKKQNDELVLAKDKAEESDRLKSAFLANMSHEIRTPMNGILGFADLLKKPDITKDEQLNFIEIIEQSGKRMLGIINDLVDISKIESGQMEIVKMHTNLIDLLDYTYSFFRPEVENKGMELRYSVSLIPQEAVICTDKEKLHAVLINLVKNAIKYSDCGFIEIGCERIDGVVEFYVQDSGIGIASDKLETVFDRFVQADVEDTRATQGAGLGLSISKAYAELLGGNIKVESQLGVGTKFTVSIPFNHMESTDVGFHEIKGNTVAVSNQKLKILIAEDDEISSKLVSITVSEFSRETLIVNNGQDAVNVLRVNPDIDLILMDIKMPLMNGLDATKEIRTFNSEVFIIAQTAFGFTADEQYALNAGCNAYISKPINQALLKEIIRKKILEPTP